MLKLGKLSLQGIERNRLVFTISDITKIFPNVDKNSKLARTHGFGLLQVVQNIGMTQMELEIFQLHTYACISARIFSCFSNCHPVV